MCEPFRLRRISLIFEAFYILDPLWFSNQLLLTTIILVGGQVFKLAAQFAFAQTSATLC